MAHSSALSCSLLLSLSYVRLLTSFSACLTLRVADSKQGGKRVPEHNSPLINLNAQAGLWQEGAQT